MKKLTDEEINKYLLPKNNETGVDAITKDMLKQIDKSELEILYREGDFLIDSRGCAKYKYDSFTPKAWSHYLKPSFAGRQFALGMVDGEIIFSNGQWFYHGVKVK